MLLIQKRNGELVDFDKLKIINAITKAFLEVDGQLYETDTAKDIADDIEKRIENFENRNYNLSSKTDFNEIVQEIQRKISVEEIR